MSLRLLKPLIAFNGQVDATFESPAKYDPAVKADIVILDRFAPPSRPQVSSIWIEPPAAGSPIVGEGDAECGEAGIVAHGYASGRGIAD